MRIWSGLFLLQLSSYAFVDPHANVMELCICWCMVFKCEARPFMVTFIFINVMYNCSNASAVVSYISAGTNLTLPPGEKVYNYEKQTRFVLADASFLPNLLLFFLSCFVSCSRFEFTNGLICLYICAILYFLFKCL